MQDVRDLILHIVADAPPVGWVRIEVRADVCALLLSSHLCRIRTVYKRQLFCLYLGSRLPFSASRHFLLRPRQIQMSRYPSLLSRHCHYPLQRLTFLAGPKRLRLILVAFHLLREHLVMHALQKHQETRRGCTLS